MGVSVSKSRLERRNTILRRSQKKTLVQSEAQIEKLLKDIRKFKGVEEDEEYNQLKKRIDNCKHDLARKSKDLHPQVRILHARALEMLSPAEFILESKLKENIEKANEKKAKESKRKKDKTKNEENNENKDSESNNNDHEITIEDLERQRDGAVSPLSNRSVMSEQNSLISSTEKRKTVELSFIKIEPKEEPLVMSPEEKRKSILKHGVQVLPTLNNEMLPRRSIPNSNPTSPVSQRSSQSQNRFTIEGKNSLEDFAAITKEVGVIEEEISKFEGKKNSLQYSNLKERLFSNLDKLSEMPDKSDKTYIQLKQYIESCLSFLDEKAIVDEGDDEVFLPETPRTVSAYKITAI